MKEKIVQFKKKILIFFFVIFTCFISDRISKIYIIDLFTNNHFKDYYINEYFNFILLWNKGIAFGLFESVDIVYHIISFLILLVIMIISFLIYKSEKISEVIFYSMVAGGAMGNFFDRIYYNAVPDFIDIHYNNFHWFTFNVSDICITIGIILLLIFDVFSLNNNKNE